MLRKCGEQRFDLYIEKPREGNEMKKSPGKNYGISKEGEWCRRCYHGGPMIRNRGEKITNLYQNSKEEKEGGVEGGTSDSHLFLGRKSHH